MKKEPKAVYIIENGGYTELTYEEFRRRVQICPLYADKLFLPLYGSLMEVSKEDYEEYYRQRNRQIYIDRRASRNGDVSYNALTTDEFNGEDILIAEQPDVCDTVVESIMTDKLKEAILKLTDEEQLLIYRHYYAGISGTDLAEIYGVSQQAISKRIAKIRAKLKNLLENSCPHLPLHQYFLFDPYVTSEAISGKLRSENPEASSGCISAKFIPIRITSSAYSVIKPQRKLKCVGSKSGTEKNKSPELNRSS